MVESIDTVPDCVKNEMLKEARKQGDNFTKEAQKQALKDCFGMCKTKKTSDMDENKLRKAINQVEAEMKEKGITDSEERETYYRMRFMKAFSTGTVKIKQDASILSKGISKTKENKQRSIFFRPYRPLETLNEVTKTSGKNTSSNIAGMEYSEGMLKVTFNWEGKGEVEYGYDVGPDFYDKMAKSQSKGKFLWSELRGKTPGYVIDNPRKMTPGGVGGSIVPYTKITKRAIQGDEFKRLQKHYAGQLKGKVKVVAHMPFVRAKQKIISRESKGFGKTPSLDFVWIKVATLSDTIPIKGYMRNGKWVEAHDRKGDKAEELKKKIRERGIEKTPLPKAEIKGEKKAQKREPRVVSEEKRRKTLDKQISRMKPVAAPEPREAAIQKLIEETGMGRKQAEERIAKVMGVSPEVAEKKAEVKEHEIKFKVQNKALSVKLIALNQINAKINSVALGNIVKLFLKAFTLLATKKDPVQVLKNFSSYYKSLKKDKKMVIKEKDELITQIGKIHKELIALSKKKADFSVKAHFRKGKPVAQHEKVDKKKQKSYGKIEYKYLKKRVGEIGKTLKSLKKKMDAGDEEAKKNYYILLKYKNKLEDDKFKAEGRKLFGDFEYISAAVDQCAKRAIARAGGKGNYNTEVANCIRMIGIQRRQAGLAPRRTGTQREQRRGVRRARTPERRVARRERVEGRQRQVRVSQAIQRAEQRRQVQNEAAAQAARTLLRNVTTQLNRGNLRMAEESHRAAIEQINRIEENEELWQELQHLRNTAADRLNEHREELREGVRERAARQTQQEALSALRRYQLKVQRYMREPDFPAVETVINLARRELEKLIDENTQWEWLGAVNLWQQELTAAQEAHHQRYAAGTERIREILESREERLAREARERVRAGVRESRQRRLREAGRFNAESSVSGLNESEGGIIHLETSAEELGRVRILRDPPEQYYISTTERRPVPEGMEIRRRGGLVNYPSGRIGWRRATFQPAGTRQGGVSSVRRAVRRRSYPGRGQVSRRAETAAQRVERENRRTRHGPKIRWKTRIRLGGRRISSFSDIKRSDLRSGYSLYLSAIAKKDYEFPDPSSPNGVFILRKGQDVGGAEFTVKHHPRTGLYLYLDLLSINHKYRGRGASSHILKPAIMMVDRLNLVIGGSPAPINREREVAPSHLSPSERIRWSSSNRGDLLNYYRAMEGEENWEYGGSFARFPHPERIAARSSDLIKRFDQVPRFIVYKYPENITEIDGYFFYYDPEIDLYYHLNFENKGEK